MEGFSKKTDWHKSKIKNIKRHNKYKPPAKNTKNKNEINSNRDGKIPTPVIDVADSSDDRYSQQTVEKDIWKHYSGSDSDDDIDDDNENEQMKAANFENLKEFRHGDYFTLNSEKQWEDESEKLDISSSYFTMNLKLMKIGLQSIPFYKRMDYEQSLFTKHQIKEMNTEAEDNEKEYQILLKNYEKEFGQQQGGNSIDDQLSQKSEKASKVKSEKHGSENEKDELDELLNLTTKNVENIKLSNEQNSKKSANPDSLGEVMKAKQDDIEDWLDSVLDP